MAKVVMYSTAVCPYCQRAEMFLKQLDSAQRDAMMQKTGRRTVPQIYIGERHVGGFDDLAALDRQGALAPLLAG
jgi:glutaredoxin 3